MSRESFVNQVLQAFDDVIVFGHYYHYFNIRFYHIITCHIELHRVNLFSAFVSIFLCFLFFDRKKFQALRLMVLQMPIIQGTLLLLLNVFNAIDTVNSTCVHMHTTNNITFSTRQLSIMELICVYSHSYTEIIRSKPADSNALHCSIHNDRRMGSANHFAYDCQTLARSQNYVQICGHSIGTRFV